jgi:hypothetical protein
MGVVRTSYMQEKCTIVFFRYWIAVVGRRIDGFGQDDVVWLMARQGLRRAGGKKRIIIG